LCHELSAINQTSKLQTSHEIIVNFAQFFSSRRVVGVFFELSMGWRVFIYMGDFYASWGLCFEKNE